MYVGNQYCGRFCGLLSSSHFIFIMSSTLPLIPNVLWFRALLQTSSTYTMTSSAIRMKSLGTRTLNLLRVSHLHVILRGFHAGSLCALQMASFISYFSRVWGGSGGAGGEGEFAWGAAGRNGCFLWTESLVMSHFLFLSTQCERSLVMNTVVKNDGQNWL